MSDAKFTSGVWIVDLGGSVGHVKALLAGSDKTPTVARYDVITPSLSDEHRKANAHLIAAAPDMYRMLEACEKTFAALYPTEVEHVQPEHYSEFKAVHHLIGSIQNSLSKARGE